MIDINTERAVKEQQFERNDGKVMKSIFDEERIEEYGNPEEDQDGEEGGENYD